MREPTSKTDTDRPSSLTVPESPMRAGVKCLLISLLRLFCDYGLPVRAPARITWKIANREPPAGLSRFKVLVLLADPVVGWNISAAESLCTQI
jgi:hypothetical protein